MERKIEIDGKIVNLKCSALSPRAYRKTFGRDMIVDLENLRRRYNTAVLASQSDSLTDEQRALAQLKPEDLEMFENLAWLFCRAGDPDGVPDNPDEWLESMDGMFSIYQVLPEIINLWNDAQRTTSIPKNA